ncbi:MAG: peptide ABC transporter substrate-binding protein [Chloroflexota bacterium]|nr:MAG: peptide ABC transporter substrate-binding protein [Chloroflexota bacterium]
MAIKRVGRRGVLAGGLALSATALLAACAAPAPTATPVSAKPAEAPKPAAPIVAAPAAAPTRPAEAPKPEPTKPVAAPAPTKPAAVAKPAATGRGSAGTLKVLYWQGPTILNPALSVGTKDVHASRLVCEPLMTFDAAGNFVPVLAAEVPSKSNGGLSEDGKSVTYKLKKDIKWADGKPFTADDVVFTYKFIIDKETASTQVGGYTELDKVEAVDPLTVKLTFKAPAPGWFVPFVGEGGQIIPKHALEQYMGAKSREAPFNLKSFGTGPFMVDSFKPGDSVIYVANPNYRDPAKPAFGRVEMKGGGDAVSAARAVFQTAEYDFAWNLQVEWAVLDELIKTGGKGTLLTLPGIGVEAIHFNMTDPNKEVDGEKSSLKSKHPFLTDKKVREALSLAIDRDTMAKQLYGETGVATPNVLTTPPKVNSKATKYTLDLAAANKILDDAGYKKGADGIRVTPDGVKMKVVFATSINSLRQKEQALIKDGWQKIGVETELKAIDAGVFFASDPGKPDTIGQFPWDAQMFTSTFGSPSPEGYMKSWYSGDVARDIAQKANKWSGDNRQRWISADFNKAFDAAIKELDPEKSAALWAKANDVVVNEFVSIPLIDRKRVDAYSKRIKGPMLVPFDSDPWNMGDWTVA